VPRTTVRFRREPADATIAPVSYTGARTYRTARPTASPGRAVATWLLKAALTTLLGLAGYLFVTQMAVPSLVNGIVGQHQAPD
jgi:hypothetical protein